MEKQQGRTATVTKKKGEVSVGKARAKNRPLTIAYPDPPYPLEGRRSLGKFLGRSVDVMLRDQPDIEVERVVVQVYLKDPEAWVD